MIELSSLIRRYSALTEDEKNERDTRPVLVIESPLPEDLDKVGGQTMSREQYEAWQQAIKLVGGKRIVPIFNSEFVIGRDDADLQIPDPSISRRHIAVRQQEDGAVVVTDLGSSHGTLVNAEPLPPPAPDSSEP